MAAELLTSGISVSTASMMTNPFGAHVLKCFIDSKNIGWARQQEARLCELYD